jgi:hypothetical protein
MGLQGEKGTFKDGQNFKGTKETNKLKCDGQTTQRFFGSPQFFQDLYGATQ